MSKTIESVLEIRTGRLADTFPLFDASTIQHAHEIMTARRTDASLRNQWFWTADFPMYRVEGNEAVHYFAPIQQNLGFRDIKNFTSQLLTNQNYVPSKKGIEELVEASKTGAVLRTKLSDLNLQGTDKEWRFFEIDTANYHSLNASQRAFAERVYGQSQEFVENIKMLYKTGKANPRIYVLNPDYVKLKVKEDGAIARASRLGRFDGGSGFVAFGRVVDVAGVGLRGVVAPQKIKIQPTIDYNALFEQVTRDPSGAAKHLNDRTARVLLAVLNQFYNP